MRYDETEDEYWRRLDIWGWQSLLTAMTFHAAWMLTVLWFTA